MPRSRDPSSRRRTRRVSPARRGTSGFTLVEALVVVGIVGVLIGILLPVLGRARAAGRSVTCVANLRNLGMGFRLYAERNQNLLPIPSVTKASWESSLRPYVQISTFACPADGELFPSIGSSYDWRDTGRPETSLAGKDITVIGRSELVIVFEALPGWHAKKKINACTVDGSARIWDEEACFADLDKDVHDR